MDKRFVCYCGLYCENCSVRAKVKPAANALRDALSGEGLDRYIGYIPGGEGFWPFLEGMAGEKVFTSCIKGCGNPDCKIRICAKEKHIEACAFCESYPCAHFDDMLRDYPMIAEDNRLLKEKGFDVWGALQDRRRAQGFTYQEQWPAATV